MLELIIGTDWTANRAVLLDKIACEVKNRKGGIVLMVPELISHDTERRLCDAAGDTASRYAEVLTFTRLARRVAERYGGTARECLDNGGRVVAMAAAARSLHSKLKVYASVETKPEFLTGLIDAVDEFKRCCISADDLRAASAQSSGTLAQKLEELALILDAYDAICAQGKRDPRDQETQLLEQLEDGDFGENHVFYIDGFPDFTRQHLAVLEHLIRVSEHVTVSVNCDRVSSDAMAFEKAGHTAAELIRCARKAGVEVHIQTVHPRDDCLESLRQLLFQGKIERTGALDGRLTVLSAESVHQECMAAAEKIQMLVRSGCRYRDISIVCGAMPAYEKTLDLVLRRCGIPLYQSGTDDILQKSVISGLLTALDVVIGNFEQRDVLRYMRSVLSSLDIDLCDNMENYAILWGISGSRWTQIWDKNPSGLGEAWTDYARGKLNRLNAARSTVITPLEHLRKDFASAVTLADQVDALYRFMEEIGLRERMERMAQSMDDHGDNRSAQILNQLWDILIDALKQLRDVLGQTKWELQAFQRLFVLLLSQYDVGTIPPVLDAVMYGPVTAMRCQEPKHLIILGAEEGSLPGYGGSTGVLTDQDRTALRSMGVPLTGGAIEGIQAEFAEIYGVFCGAKESVTVSCCGQPSFVYRRLAEMAGTVAMCDAKYGPALFCKEEAGAYLARFDAADEARSLGVEEAYGQICSGTEYDLGSIEADTVSKLYGSKMNLSASQIDRQAECRLSYFLKYGLRLKERKEASIDPAEFGTYVHAVLEDTAREIMEQGGFHKVSLEETMTLARKYSDAYAADRFAGIDSQRMEYLFRRNSQELEMVVEELWNELRRSAFEPVDFETNFGPDGKLPAIPIPSKAMDAQLLGFVDRVDAWKEAGRNYFRVVDYKTGKKDFDYCDVFNGIGLQMLLYLFALEAGGEPILGQLAIPAGVQYFPARVPVVSSDGRMTDGEAEELRQKEWKRRGLLLGDEDVLRAMEPEDAPPRLCAKKKKDGSYTGDLADREQLQQLKEYIFAVVGRMVDDIASGNVTPNPYTRGTSHNACSFCPYGAVCHKEQVEGRRNYKAMKPERFWEEIGKEADRHG